MPANKHLIRIGRPHCTQCSIYYADIYNIFAKSTHKRYKNLGWLSFLFHMRIFYILPHESPIHSGFGSTAGMMCIMKTIE